MMIDNRHEESAASSVFDDEPNGVDTSPWRARFNVIHLQLRDRITLLDFPPGTRLDPGQLAREFKVSRTPIRSVFQRLEYEGLVTTRHGVGTIVNDIDFGSFHEVASMRIHLAALIGTLDPVPVQEDAIEKMDELVVRLDRLRGKVDLQEFARIDLANHKQVARLIGNSILRRTYNELYYRNARMWFYLLPQLDWDTEISTFGETIKLERAAMAQGDVVATGFIARNAISNVVYRLSHLLNCKSEA